MHIKVTEVIRIQDCTVTYTECGIYGQCGK